MYVISFTLFIFILCSATNLQIITSCRVVASWKWTWLSLPQSNNRLFNVLIPRTLEDPSPRVWHKTPHTCLLKNLLHFVWFGSSEDELLVTLHLFKRITNVPLFFSFAIQWGLGHSFSSPDLVTFFQTSFSKFPVSTTLYGEHMCIIT